MRDGSGCFACGPQNPIGLRLKFTAEGDRVRAEFTPGSHYQGYEGVLHGGIVTAALDDAMAQLFHMRGQESLTARLEIRFRREAPVGRRLVVIATLTGERAKLYTAEAVLSLPDGTPLAEAKGTFVRGA
ncbi:MAG TPA: PaaI family thioesterase [bacterium]|nr:PaaI family thioesterase [bacterium]